jgi:5-formyltetrahydrofolate cyclo-ligase
MERKQSFPESAADETAFFAIEHNADSIRRMHKERRNAMSREQVAEWSRHICDKILAAECYEKHSTIYGYYPLGNEVDCLPVLKQALLDGKNVALPRTKTDCGMEFYQISSLEQVKEGAFHVMEPVKNCPLVQAREGLVLVPGVVFDTKGARYGYGKGYYDRYFARFPELYRMGLAYANQMEEKLFVQETDIPVNIVVTDKDIWL